MVQLTPEETLLLLTCRVSLSRDEEARIAAIVGKEPDWSFVLWRAETYQTIPLINFHLERLKLTETLDESIAAYIQNWTALSEARSREQFRELGRVLSQLQRLGVDHFLMKGVAIASTIYPDPLLRPMQDLDIMIQPRDAWRVQRAIYRAGYRHGVFNPRDGRFTPLFRKITPRLLRAKHSLHSVTRTLRVPSPVPTRTIAPSWQKRQIKSFANADGTLTMPVFIDFHVNLSAGMELTDVWRGCRDRAVLGQTAKVQSPTAMLWFSAARLYHEAFQHGTLKLQMFGDIDAILRASADEIDWAELLVMAKKYKIEPALYYVLSQSQRLNEAPVPDGVLELLEPSQQRAPAEHDWGDIIPKLLSRPVVNDFEFA
jgi:hypothetical protein